MNIKLIMIASQVSGHGIVCFEEFEDNGPLAVVVAPRPID
jgi:hypothetical protein